MISSRTMFLLSIGAVLALSVLCAAQTHSHESKEPASADIASPIKVCPKGFSQSGKMCVKTLTKREHRQCPKRAKFDAGACLSEKEVRANDVCPTGFTLAGKHCEAVDAIGAYIECPKGYALTEKVGEEAACVRSSEAQAEESCESGFKRNMRDGLCYSETKVKATSVCPRGTEPSRRGCVSVEMAEKEVRCSPGYLSQAGSDECVRVSPTRVDHVCPSGYRKSSSNMCVMSKKERAMEVCPPGSRADGLKGCLSESVSAAVARCRKEYKLIDNRCIKTVEESPSYDCEHGMVAEGNVCRLKHHSRPEFICADGSMPGLGNFCESSDSTPAELECSGGGEMINGQCVKRSTKKASIACPKFFKEELGNCIREITVKPQDLCGEGFLPGRVGECVATETAVPVKSCKTGTLMSNGICVEIDTTSSKYVCPKGYKQEQAASPNCVRKMVLQVRSVCPEGSLARGGKCVVEERSAPVTDCDNGWSMGSDGCVKILEREPSLECPGGYKMIHGICLAKAQKSGGKLLDNKKFEGAAANLGNLGQRLHFRRA